MAKLTISTKRLQINKANGTMIALIAGTSFVLIFSVIASRALLSQRAYQSRVIAEKTKAKMQLDENVKAADKLKIAYQEFVSAPENVLGGNPAGTGDKDGDNAKIVLDALPSKYDFPALTTSLEKILSDKNYKIDDISGSDDELNQKANLSSPNPVAVDIPFKITVSGSYPALQTLVSAMERSIRPFHIQTIDFSGNDALLRMEIKAKSYYQPEKNLTITTKDVQ
jgi:hypothetical protein